MVRARSEFRKWPGMLCRENRGGIAMLTGLMLPVLVGFVGLGLDTANWYSNHRKVETIVESAAVAGRPTFPP